jgi:hypothetical protein
VVTLVGLESYLLPGLEILCLHLLHLRSKDVLCGDSRIDAVGLRAGLESAESTERRARDEIEMERDRDRERERERAKEHFGTLMEITKWPPGLRKWWQLRARMRAWSGCATSAKTTSTIPTSILRRPVSGECCSSCACTEIGTDAEADACTHTLARRRI